MAKNPKESRSNKHTLAMGISGAGKSYWLANHPWVKKSGVKMLVWDPYQSHDCHYIESRAKFAKEVSQALKSRRGFRLGLSVHPTPDNFEWFCRVVWASLDGSRETVVMVEELADVARPGKAGPNWGQLIRVGRKYGAVLLVATQRPQEIEKTLFTQVSRKWAGLVSPYDSTYVEKHLGLERGSLQGIEPESYKFAYVHGSNVQWGGPKMKKIRY